MGGRVRRRTRPGSHDRRRSQQRRQVGGDVRDPDHGRPGVLLRCSRPTPTGSCAAPATAATGSSRSGGPGSTQDVPAVIDPAMIGMALDETQPGRPRLAMLMPTTPPIWSRPATPRSLPPSMIGSSPTWRPCMPTRLGWQDDLGLSSMEQRLLFFAPATIAPELVREPVPGPLRVAAQGWARLPTARPEPARAGHRRARRSGPAGRADRARHLRPSSPGTGNSAISAVRPDGDSIVARLGLPRSGAAVLGARLVLALNRARLPEPARAIARYRAALEAAGCSTAGWWNGNWISA